MVLLQSPSKMERSNYVTIIFMALLLVSGAAGQAEGSHKDDTRALVRFQAETDAHAALAANWTTQSGGGDACSAAWSGVRCSGGRVTALSLPSISLRGPITALAALDQLRLLDLRDNRLNASLLPLANCTNLKLLYLSRNDFSGSIPDEMGGLHRLLRLDLSDNNLSGVLPVTLALLTRLVTLRLQNNALSGQLPDLTAAMPALRQFNVSNNQLFGEAPEMMRQKFGNESLAGNAMLCRPSPGQHGCTSKTNTTTNSFSLPPPSDEVVPSNPSSMPGSAIVLGNQHNRDANDNGRRTLSTAAIVGIVIADGVVLVLISSFLLAYFCGRARRVAEGGDHAGGKGRKLRGGRMSTTSSSSTTGTDHQGVKRAEGSSEGSIRTMHDDEQQIGEERKGGGGGKRGRLVFYGREREFELEELLRASAEMVGKGNLGTVYRAVLEDGKTVAVKRLKDSNPCERREFQRYMEVIGKLRHPNLVRLRAYYYAKEEKLLIYDYLPNGTLHSLLHGIPLIIAYSSSPILISFSWAYVHTSILKSSN